MSKAIRQLLPRLLVFVTRHPRYLPDIVWSSSSWTHNIFRAYELIFWRRYGIRAESSTWTDGTTFHIKLFTLEAICAHIEHLIRKVFTVKWLDVRIVSLQLAVPSAIQIPWISFAIALDVADTGTSTSATPLTWSHTVTGSNPLLAVGSGINGSTSPTTSSVSYNSVAATKARADTGSGSVSGIIQSSVWLLGNPATGSNTVSVSFSGGGSCVAGAVSYSGAQSGSAADAVNGTNGTTAAAQSFNVTTVADNCWVFATGAIAGGVTPSFSTPTQTSRWSTTLIGVNTQVGQDNNAAKTPAGAVSIGWTTAGTTSSTYRWAMTGASFAPAGAAFTWQQLQTSNQPQPEPFSIIPY